MRYSLFLLFCQPRQQGVILKFRKWLYLSPCVKIKRIKGSLFLSTFKVWENKVPLVFSIFAQGLRYSHFLIFCQPRQQGNILEFRKWLYLSPWAKIEKTKGTLFSETLKVEGNKVPLIFLIFAQGLRYDHSVNMQVFSFAVPYWK